MWEYSLVTGINSPIICNYIACAQGKIFIYLYIYLYLVSGSVNKSVDLCHQLEIDSFVLSMVINKIDLIFIN